MTDKITTIEQLREKIDKFSEERNWNDGSNGKNLAMALTVEAGELLEIFMWKHSDEADEIRNNSSEFTHLKEEIADIFWYLMRICNHYEIDLTDAVFDKAIKNAKKYPPLSEVKKICNET